MGAIRQKDEYIVFQFPIWVRYRRASLELTPLKRFQFPIWVRYEPSVTRYQINVSGFNSLYG